MCEIETLGSNNYPSFYFQLMDSLLPAQPRAMMHCNFVPLPGDIKSNSMSNITELFVLKMTRCIELFPIDTRCFEIKRKVWQRVGPFSEMFIIYLR